MAVSTDDIKKLRDKTGVSIMQCREALEEAGGDEEKAMELLRKQGAKMAAKKGDRELKAGYIGSYVHNTGVVAAMVEVLCETDFVAKNEGFRQLAYDLAMQATATDDYILENGSEEFLKQSFIKDSSKTIADLIQDAIQKYGERTEIGKIVKLAI